MGALAEKKAKKKAKAKAMAERKKKKAKAKADALEKAAKKKKRKALQAAKRKARAKALAERKKKKAKMMAERAAKAKKTHERGYKRGVKNAKKLADERKKLAHQVHIDELHAAKPAKACMSSLAKVNFTKEARSMVKLLTMLKAGRMSPSQLINAAKYSHRLAQRVRALSVSGHRARLAAVAGKDS